MTESHVISESIFTFSLKGDYNQVRDGIVRILCSDLGTPIQVG